MGCCGRSKKKIAVSTASQRVSSRSKRSIKRTKANLLKGNTLLNRNMASPKVSDLCPKCKHGLFDVKRKVNGRLQMMEQCKNKHCGYIRKK